jgi:hypothetical protein
MFPSMWSSLDSVLEDEEDARSGGVSCPESNSCKRWLAACWSRSECVHDAAAHLFARVDSTGRYPMLRTESSLGRKIGGDSTRDERIATITFRHYTRRSRAGYKPVNPCTMLERKRNRRDSWN